MKKTLAILILVLCTATIARGAETPYLTGRVNDYAGILSQSVKDSLGSILKDHELRTSNQVVVLTINSLEGESIEDFANKVFNEWKLGQKDRDNGILIVVVPGERRMRIEVGYGLEGVLPDISAGRIIQNVMAPLFREGDFNGGITAGVESVLSILEGGEEPAYEGGTESASTEGTSFLSDIDRPDMSLGTRILMGAFIFGIIGLFTLIGIMTPGVGWFLYLFLIPFWATFPIIILGTRGALICFFLYLFIYPAAKIYLKKTAWYKKATNDLRTKGSASIGGFTLTSGGSGGSWSSGGSSGGGFSGGGGSSGGGGASGSW